VFADPIVYEIPYVDYRRDFRYRYTCSNKGGWTRCIFVVYESSCPVRRHNYPVIK